MEIKEILEILRRCTYGDEVYLIKEHGATVLLDYITNLQQENERLKEHKEYYKNETKRLGKLFYITKEENIKLEEAQKNFEKQFIKEMDYKSRIEKAVEYIKKHIEKCNIDGYEGKFDNFDIFTKPQELIDTLNGKE